MSLSPEELEHFRRLGREAPAPGPERYARLVELARRELAEHRERERREAS